MPTDEIATGLRYSRKALLVLLSLTFAVSIVVRLPHLDKPLGLHHEEGTARTLVHSLAWWNDGPTARGYLLRLTLDSPGDKFLGSDSTMDDAGNAYYYSLPPGHPLSMFLPHRLVGVEPTVLSVRLINVLLHLLSGVMVFLITSELLRNLPVAWRRAAASGAFVLYALSPVTMWYQSNSYTSASAVQPLFAAGVLVAVRAYRPDGKRTVDAALMALVTFLMVYTEWLGLAFAAVTVAVALFRRKDPVARWIALGAVGGAVAAVAVVAFQYSEFMGLSGLVSHFTSKYGMRSGLGDQSTWAITSFESWRRFAAMYTTSLAPSILALGILWSWDRIAGRGRPSKMRAGTAPVWAVFGIATLPVAIHHLVLFDHAVAHDFDTLKMAIPVSVACGYYVARLLARSNSWTSESRTAAVVSIAGMVLLASVASIALFGYVNPIRRMDTQALGEVLGATAQPEEVVFVSTVDYVPPRTLTYYARRNYVAWSTPERASAVLQRAGGRVGILFVVDNRGGLHTSYVGQDGNVYETREQARGTLAQ